MPEVAVIDYGVGNLLSVRRALMHCGADVAVTSDPDTILAARRVVLPGVGAFANGMQALRKRGLDAVVRSVAGTGKPLLGICLGMQMLMDTSEEFGETAGLGLIPGKVVGIPKTDPKGRALKVPHVGWSELILPHGLESWEGTVLQDINPGEATYFLHSFMACPRSSSHRLASYPLGELSVCAAVRNINIIGLQFHPEKSGATGVSILARFLKM